MDSHDGGGRQELSTSNLSKGCHSGMPTSRHATVYQGMPRSDTVNISPNFSRSLAKEISHCVIIIIYFDLEAALYRSWSGREAEVEDQ